MGRKDGEEIWQEEMWQEHRILVGLLFVVRREGMPEGSGEVQDGTSGRNGCNHLPFSKI